VDRALSAIKLQSPWPRWELELFFCNQRNKRAFLELWLHCLFEVPVGWSRREWPVSTVRQFGFSYPKLQLPDRLPWFPIGQAKIKTSIALCFCLKPHGELQGGFSIGQMFYSASKPLRFIALSFGQLESAEKGGSTLRVPWCPKLFLRILSIVFGGPYRGKQPQGILPQRSTWCLLFFLEENFYGFSHFESCSRSNPPWLARCNLQDKLPFSQ